MLGLLFADAIERHADALSTALVHKLQTSERTPSFRQVPVDELRGDIFELYQHLTEWLATKTEGDVRQRQHRLGAFRAKQHIPIEEFLWAIILSKRNILEHMESEIESTTVYKLIVEVDFVRTLDEFFDRAIYHAICGYTQQLKSSAALRKAS
ncbi:MAG TPA: histidine kinase N-terminal domain-containing protein [Clostridia bacterium]|nr:histidine kinase N-terminal domain-containing protein [Clostridia bacterium]